MEGGFQLSVFSNQFSVKSTKYGIKVTKRAIGYDCSFCNLQFAIAQFAIKNMLVKRAQTSNKGSTDHSGLQPVAKLGN
jgi:hypothetical protein